MNRTDIELVTDYINGDEQALNFLIKRYTQNVYYFVYRLSGSGRDSEDIVQDVFVKVWKNIDKYDAKQNFRTWLFTIARNTTIDWLRKKKHVPLSSFDSDEGDNIISDTAKDNELLPDELAEKADDKMFVEKILQTLSPENREILFLHYNEELTFDEIGKILRKPLHTVKSQHRRALLSLRDKIGTKN
ncbi:MAG: RNA polymerase sigma factor [Candidatus Paceibacterota bacterium]|jgi:RNA polymerase sigma-70 factor (ECF subfamily)